MKNFETMKKEKEEDVRNGPVVVYVANGKRSIVPKIDRIDSQEFYKAYQEYLDSEDPQGEG
jgi:hypothetical protein